MTIEQEERLVKSFEIIASSLDRLAILSADRLEREHPRERKPKRAAEIHRPSDEKAEQFSDKAGEEWFNETESGDTGDGEPKSRFRERFEKENPPAKE